MTYTNVSILEASCNLCNLETDVDVSRGLSTNQLTDIIQLLLCSAQLNREIGRTQEVLQSVPPLGVSVT